MSTGLRFFKRGTPSRFRRRRWIFAAAVALIGMMMIWPIYPQFGGIEPLILGLPLSFAWILFAMALMFCALLWLYLSDLRDHDREDS